MEWIRCEGSYLPLRCKCTGTGKILRDFFAQILAVFANSYELLERLLQVLPVVQVVTGYKQRLLGACFFYELGFPQQAHE